MLIRTTSKQDLQAMHIILAVMDYDVIGTDDLMGQVVLPVSRFCKSKPVPFEEVMTLNGQLAGTISGELQVCMCVCV